MVTAPGVDGSTTGISSMQKTRPERSAREKRASTVWERRSFSASLDSAKAWGLWEGSSDGTLQTTGGIWELRVEVHPPLQLEVHHWLLCSPYLPIAPVAVEEGSCPVQETHLIAGCLRFLWAGLQDCYNCCCCHYCPHSLGKRPRRLRNPQVFVCAAAAGKKLVWVLLPVELSCLQFLLQVMKWQLEMKYKD